MRSYVEWVTRHRRLVIILALATTAVIASRVKRLTLIIDLNNIVPRSHLFIATTLNPSPGLKGATLTRIAASLALSLVPVVPSYAWDDTKVDLRLSVGADVGNAPGSVLVSGRYGGDWGAKIGFWENRTEVQSGAPNMLIGIDHVWTYSSWRAGFGLVWIDRVNKLNGTHLDFDLSLAYDLSSRVSLEYRHFSHGGMFGIDRNAPNRGWNLIGVGLIF